MTRSTRIHHHGWIAMLSAAVWLCSLLAPPAAHAVCSTTSTALCVQGNRFRVEIDWTGFGGDGGEARVVSQQTSDSGLFYFFGPNNWEVLVKVINACSGPGSNNRYWVFAASATTLQFTLTVTDTNTGAVRTYFNPLGNPAAAITDTLAFATCGNGPQPGQDPQVRYLNNLVCNQQGFTSTISANGFSWTSFSGTPSPYQSVNRSSLGPTIIETNDSPCPNATFGGNPFALSQGQRYALVQTTQGQSRILGIINEGPAQTVEEQSGASPADAVAEVGPDASMIGTEFPK